MLSSPYFVGHFRGLLLLKRVELGKLLKTQRKSHSPFLIFPSLLHQPRNLSTRFHVFTPEPLQLGFTISFPAPEQAGFLAGFLVCFHSFYSFSFTGLFITSVCAFFPFPLLLSPACKKDDFSLTHLSLFNLFSYFLSFFLSLGKAFLSPLLACLNSNTPFILSP